MKSLCGILLVILSLDNSAYAIEYNISGEYQWTVPPAYDPWTHETKEGSVTRTYLITITQSGGAISIETENHTLTGKVNGHKFTATRPVNPESYETSSSVKEQIKKQGKIVTLEGRIEYPQLVDVIYKSWWARWEDYTLMDMQPEIRNVKLVKIVPFGPAPANAISIEDQLRFQINRAELSEKLKISDDIVNSIWDQFTEDDTRYAEDLPPKYRRDFLGFALDILLDPPEEISNQYSSETNAIIRIVKAEPPEIDHGSVSAVDESRPWPKNYCRVDNVQARMFGLNPSFRRHWNYTFGWYNVLPGSLVGKGAVVKKKALMASLAEAVRRCKELEQIVKDETIGIEDM